MDKKLIRESYLLSVSDVIDFTRGTILARSRAEFKEIVRLLPDTTILLNVSVLDDLLDGKDYIEDLKEKINPEDLEFGNTHISEDDDIIL